MRLSTDPTRDDARSLEVLAAALDGGIALLDTADVYALDDSEIGHNESLIANAIARTRGDHDAAALAKPAEVVTKGGLARDGVAWIPSGRAKHLQAAARASRDRLGVDAIDLYLLHAVDPRVPLATSVRALAKLRDAGVVRAVGLSNVNVHQLEQALEICPIAAVEVELSPYKLDALRGALVHACSERGIRVLAHRPLGGPAGVKRLGRDTRVRELAAAVTGRAAPVTPPELVLAWLQALGTIPLPGATRVETARSIARAGSLVLPDEIVRALEEHFVAIGRTAVASPGTPPQSAEGAATSSAEVCEVGVAVSADVASSSDARELGAPGDRAVASSAEVREVGVPVGADVASSGVARDVGGSVGGAVASWSSAREVVVIAGMPAAGKSTLAADYEARGYVRLNRDDRGGTLLELAKALDRELAAGVTKVVLDNTYGTRASRQPVIAVARRHRVPVRCVIAATSFDDAQANAIARMLELHGRVLMPQELRQAKMIAPNAQFKYRRLYEPPRTDEGFASVEEVAFARKPAPGSQRALVVHLDANVWSARAGAPDDRRLVEGARERLAAFHAAGYVLAGTTWMTSPAIDGWLVDALGVPLAILRCSHPGGPPICWCRKPMPGLLLELARARSLDLSRSIYAGALPIDRTYARRAGMQFADLTAGWPAP